MDNDQNLGSIFAEVRRYRSLPMHDTISPKQQKEQPFTYPNLSKNLASPSIIFPCHCLLASKMCSSPWLSLTFGGNRLPNKAVDEADFCAGAKAEAEARQKARAAAIFMVKINVGEAMKWVSWSATYGNHQKPEDNNSRRLSSRVVHLLTTEGVAGDQCAVNL